MWWGGAFAGYGVAWLVSAIAWVMVADEIAGMPSFPVLIPLVAFGTASLLIRVAEPSRPPRPMGYLAATVLATGGLLLLFGIAAKLTPLSGYYLDHPAAMLWSWILVLTVGPFAGVGVYLGIQGRQKSKRNLVSQTSDSVSNVSPPPKLDR